MDCSESGVLYLRARSRLKKVELGLALAIHDQLAREVIHIHPELMRVSGSQRNALQKSFKDYDKN